MDSKKLAQTIACLALALVAFAGQAFAFHLRNQDPIVQLTLNPGDVHQGSISLSNSGDKPMRISAYLQDWQYKYSSQGDFEKEFAAPGTMGRSGSNWISFFPNNLEIPPRGSAKVEYTIRVPDDQPLEGGYYSVMFFEGMAPESQDGTQGGVNVKFSTRMGSLFLINIESTVRQDMEISDIRASRVDAASPLRIEATLLTKANVLMACKSGSFHFMSPEGVVGARGDLPDIHLWPGSEPLKIQAESLGNLAGGRYNTVLTYDCNKGEIVIGESELAVP